MPMSESELRSVVVSLIEQAENFIESEVADDRKRGLQYYENDPAALPAPEISGRSGIVTHDVEDVVDWILPDLIKMFASGTKSVNFTPASTDNEEVAERNKEEAQQAGDYIGHKFWHDCDGFIIMYQWFKDALNQKNGFTKTFWKEHKAKREITLEGVTEEQVQQILATPTLQTLLAIDGIEPKGVPDTKIEIVENEEREDSEDLPLRDITVAWTEEADDIAVESLPPEEIIVVPGSTLTKQPKMIGHVRKITVSEYVEMGLGDKDEAIAIASPDAADPSDHSSEKMVRDDEGTEDVDPKDPALWEIPIWECYALIDFDQDGIAELRQVTVVGDAKRVVVNEPEDDDPFSTITPYIKPHKYFGKSVAETLFDLMELKTNITRMVIDNSMLITNQRHTALEGQFNLDDYLNNRPGGLVRVTSHDALAPMPQQELPQSVFAMLTEIEQQKGDRSGVDRASQGLNPDTLNTSGVALDLMQSAKRQKVELIGRVFAETGVKRQFELMLKLLVKHRPKKKIVMLRDKLVPIDPRFWNAHMRVNVKVGLGSGSTMRRVAALDKIAQNQLLAVQGGGFGQLVGPQDLYNTQIDLVDALDLDNPERYWTDPSTVPPPEPPPPDPKMITAQTNAQKAQADAQQKQQQMIIDATEAQAKAALEREQLELDRREAAIKAAQEEQSLELEARELELKAREIAIEAQLTALKIQQGQATNTRINGPADTL